MSTASRPPVELIDRAVMLVAFSRLVPLAAAPLTLWLVATTRPIAEQGAYFIFWNTQALTQLMEVGVGTLLVQFASHEAAFIAWGEAGGVSGDSAARRRILALIVAGRRWYTTIALIVLVVGGVGGTWLLETSLRDVRPSPSIPWLIAISCTAAYLPVVPTLCAIEGAGGLIRVQRMRLVQVIVATAVLWSVLLRWGALWGVAAFSVAWFAIAWLWLRSRHRELIDQVAAEIRESRTGAPHALSLVQWRSAVTWLAWWTAPQTLTPIVLATHGPAAAGRVGMSLAIATAPLTLATSWLYGRYPRYGSLVAAGRVDELRRVARLATLQAAAVCAAGTLAVAIVVLALSRASPMLAARVLPFTAILILGAGNLAWLLVQSLAAYLRAWRADPLSEAAVGGAIVIAMGTLIAAMQTTPFGTVTTHALIVILGMLPLSWLRSRSSRADSP